MAGLFLLMLAVPAPVRAEASTASLLPVPIEQVVAGVTSSVATPLVQVRISLSPSVPSGASPTPVAPVAGAPSTQAAPELAQAVASPAIEPSAGASASIAGKAPDVKVRRLGTSSSEPPPRADPSPAVTGPPGARLQAAAHPAVTSTPSIPSQGTVGAGGLGFGSPAGVVGRLVAAFSRSAAPEAGAPSITVLLLGVAALLIGLLCADALGVGPRHRYIGGCPPSTHTRRWL